MPAADLKTPWRRAALALVLLALFLAPRLGYLRSFVTLDEPFWLSVGANFYYALGQRELENTVYEYHPAVTTMWFVTGSMLATFPEYRGLGQGYFDVDKNKFDPFLIEHGISPLDLLYFARLIQLAALAILLLLLFFVLAGPLGDAAAFLSAGLVSAAPFFTGHSLLLNHEALLALCVLLSIASMLVYIEGERRLRYLVISGAAAAVAHLTKSSAIAMVPVVMVMLLLSAWRQGKIHGLRRALALEGRTLVLWLAATALVYIILWPGMWVAPGKMLYEVYGNAFSYAFQGARLQVTQELQPSEFALASAWPTLRAYAGDLLGRSTPATWIGAVMALVAVARGGRSSISLQSRRLAGFLLLTAALFILMFSLVQGRNSPHYIMTSHLAIDVAAALGWCGLLNWLMRAWASSWRPALRAGALVILIGYQVACGLSRAPYFYTYFNPIMAGLSGRSPGYYYGEGMELAAAYLASKPDSASTAVFAYPARGPFSYFFPGETLILNPLYLEEPGMVSMFERLTQSDFLVFYDALAQRTANTGRFVAALAPAEPEHVISVQGFETILIYEVRDLPTSFFQTLQEQPPGMRQD